MLGMSGAMTLSGQVFATVNVSVDTTSTGGSAESSTVSTSTVTASASGGSGTFTYQWVRVSGSTSITANSPTSAATYFTGVGIPSNSSIAAVFRCDVTDNIAGTVTSSANVSVSCHHDVPSISVSLSPKSTNLVADSAPGPSRAEGGWSCSVTGGSGNYSCSWSVSAGDIESGQGSTSISYAVVVADQQVYNGSVSVSVTDLDTGATGGDFGSFTVYG